MAMRLHSKRRYFQERISRMYVQLIALHDDLSTYAKHAPKAERAAESVAAKATHVRESLQAQREERHAKKASTIERLRRETLPGEPRPHPHLHPHSHPGGHDRETEGEAA